MAAEDPDFALVGRGVTAALVDLLIRSRRPLPVMVVFGPGGAGKTKLCEHVEERWRGVAPVASITIDDAGSKTCRDVLTKAANDLQRYSNRRFGRLLLPRFELANRLLSEPPPKGIRQREARARQLLAGRGMIMTQAGATAAAGVSWIGALAAALIAFGGLLRAPLVAAPPGLRWLRRLVMPGRATALAWYERRAPRLDPELPQGCDPSVVIARVWDGVWDPDERPDPRRRLVADRLLVAAFLADIEQAYRRRRRYRRLNCVLLLDGADLLSEDESNLLTAEDAGDPPAAPNVLELLAEAKLRQPKAPLLVIATKQARPDLPDCLSDADLPDTGNPVLAAEEAYERWRGQLPRQPDAAASAGGAAAQLPVILDPFTATHTRQFLAEWSRQEERTSRRETLAAEVHAVTRGHPLAVVLTSDALAERLRLDRATPVVRSLLSEPVPRQAYRRAAPQNIGDLLVQRFLQRFPEDERHDRRYHWRLLARLAAPRRLDLAMLTQLMPTLEANLDPRTTWQRLSTYSFMRAADEGRRLVMHPLLRDLLAMQLREGNAGNGLDYDQTHRLFRDFYSRPGGDAAEVAYHALALGESAPLAGLVATWARAGEPDWPARLEELVQAPQPPHRVPTIAPPARRTLRLRDRTAVKPVPPPGTAADRLVEALWRIRSATALERWTVASLEQLAHAYQDVGAGHQAVDERSAYYQRLANADAEGASVDPPELPAWAYASPRSAYPMVWLPRRAVAGAVAAVLALASLGAAAQYQRYWEGHCARPSQTVTDRLRLPLPGSPDPVLARMGDGQCIGVTDEAGVFIDGETNAGDAEVAELTRLVVTENSNAVRQATKHKVPYATVVVATMLSSVVAPNQRDLSAGINELRGAYLAQWLWNRQDAGFLGPRPPVRLLFANFGGSSAYAERTAAVIRERARQDRTIVGVTGLGQTRNQTVRAAEIIGTPDGEWPGLPMVASAPSGNDFTGMPSFFRTAPPNRRQAEVGSRFLAERFPGRAAWIVSGARDLYSSDLAADYRRLLGAPGAPFPRVESRTYEQDDTGSVNVFRPIVAEVCADAREGAPAPLVVYTGRANEAATLVRDLQQTCAGRAVVLGGDDLSQLETEGYGDLGRADHYTGEWLYFTTFGATAEGWRETKGSAATLPRFFSEYDRLRAEQAERGGKAYRTGSNGHVMLSFDALNLLLDTVEQARVPGALPTPDQVREHLRKRRDYEGVAGRVSYAGPNGDVDAGGDPVDKLVVIQQVVRDGSGPRSKHVSADGAL